MEQTGYYYVISDSNKSPILIYGKENLVLILESFKKPMITTFENQEDAKANLKAQLDLLEKNEKAKKVGRNDQIKTEAPSQGIKKMKTENDSHKDQVETVNNIVYEHYKVDSKQLTLAKYHIKYEKEFQLFFDGASKGNPGKAGAGYVIYDSQKTKVYEGCFGLGVKTNNQAEYCGFVYGLKTALDLGIKRLEVYGDSQIVIYQMTGKYKVNNIGLKPFHQEAKLLEKKFSNINYNWIRREENSVADELSNKGIDSA